MGRASVLVVDDERNILTTLSRALKMESFDVEVAGGGKIGLDKASKRHFDAVLLDVQLPDVDGLEVLRQLRAEREDLPVLMMSGHGTIETAIEATRLGAVDFIEKPVSTERLLLSLEHALDLVRLREENRALRVRAGLSDGLLGQSPAMQRLRQQIELSADANAPVLITGERGTGKELVARAIHVQSPRCKGPLEKLNCAAVPAELIESELFGHETGAFTGATKQRKGKFERAHGGTLFLDEVGDMPSAMQAKLLRVLQEGEVERVGGSEVLPIDVRVVAATNHDLMTAIDSGEFRADLYDRLHVLPLQVPPLRDRREDIPELAAQFLARASQANDRPHKQLSEGALSLLLGYDYPGNVRELKNLVERLVILTPDAEVSERDARALLPIGGGKTTALDYSPDRSLREMLEDHERALIRKALDHHKGNVTQTAEALGLERSHLYKKMKALGLR